MTKELQEDNTFKRIFTLANDINIECVRAEEFFSIHRKENFQRLKGRGQTTKQRLKEEVKRISHIRSRMSKLEHNIIKTLESMISKRKKKVDVVSKKIVKILETPGVRRKRKLLKVISNSLMLISAQAVLGVAGPIKLAATAVEALGGGVAATATADILGEISTSVADPAFYAATAELLGDQITHAATDLSNPDWYSWRMSQIEAGFAQGLDDFTNPNWWEWKGSQVADGLSEPRPVDLEPAPVEGAAAPAAVEAAPAAPAPVEAAAPAPAPVEAAQPTSIGVGAAAGVGAVAVDSASGEKASGSVNKSQTEQATMDKASELINEQAGTTVQTGGGFFRSKPMEISDEEADQQVEIMLIILDKYQLFANVIQENDSEYRKFMSKSMNKFSSKGKTQKLINIPGPSTLLQNRRTRKARKQVENRVQQKKNRSFFGKSMKMLFGERDPNVIKNIKKLKSINESYKNIDNIYNDARKQVIKYQIKSGKKRLKKPLRASDIKRYKEKKLRYEKKIEKLNTKKDRQVTKLMKAKEVVDINDKLKGIEYANTIMPSYERQQKKKITRLVRTVEKYESKIGKFRRQISEIDELLQENQGSISDRTKSSVRTQSTQIGGDTDKQESPEESTQSVSESQPETQEETTNEAPVIEPPPYDDGSSVPKSETTEDIFEEYIPKKYPQESSIANYKLGDYDFMDEDTLRNSIAMRNEFYSVLVQNSSKSHDMLIKLNLYFKNVNKKDETLKKLKENLDNAINISKKERHAVRKLFRLVEQEQNILDLLPYTNYNDNLQRLVPASSFTNVRRKVRGRLNWAIRRTLTGIYAPVDFVVSGLDVSLKAARAHRPGFMSRESRRELSEKKRSAQKRFKEKFISKTEISQEQLKSFETFHNQNEDYAIAYAEQKVSAEKELFTVIERIKQNILTNFQVKNSDDFSNSQYYKGLKEMWNAINVNNKYYSTEVTIDSKLVGSSNVAVMYASILESKNVKQDDKKKLIEVVSSRSKETSARDNLLNKLFDKNIVTEYWDCFNTCNDGQSGSDNKNKRNKYLLKMVANLRERRFNLEQLRELFTSEVEKEDEDELPVIVGSLSDKFEILANTFDQHEEQLYMIIELLKDVEAKELPKEKENELIKIGQEIEEFREKSVSDVHFIHEYLLYAFPELESSYSRDADDIVQMKTLWNSITDNKNDSNTDYKFVNALKTLKDFLFISQGLEKNHETVLQTIEFVMEARDARVEQLANEEKARMSDEVVDTITLENVANDKIKNRNDNISTTKMDIQSGKLKNEEEIPVDLDEDADKLAKEADEEDSDFDSDEEDEDDPFSGDPADENTLFKYWYCNGNCDNRKGINVTDFNWSSDVTTRERETNKKMKMLESMKEKLDELKELFMTKDKEVPEVQQIKKIITDATKSNKQQIIIMKEVVKLVERQKKLVNKFTKSGEMRETKGVIVKSNFMPQNEKIQKAASKKLSKMGGFDSGFKNAFKTLREIVSEKYPQQGTRVGAEESEAIMAKELTDKLVLAMRIIKPGEEPNDTELQPFVESLVVAIKAIKVRERIKKNKDKEIRKEEIEKFDELVDNAGSQKSREAIDKRNEHLDKLFDVTNDLQLKDATFAKSAGSLTNKAEALQKYWFCNGKCKYSFTEDIDWTTNIQSRISYMNEMKEKSVRSKRAFSYLQDLFMIDMKMNFAKISTELELDVQEQAELIGGAKTSDDGVVRSNRSAKFFEDVFDALKMIQKHTVNEVAATKGLHQLAISMRKNYKKTTTTKTALTRKKGTREIARKDTRKKGRFSVSPNFRSQVTSLENKAVVFANQKAFSAQKILELNKKIMNLIKTKMPEIANKSVSEKDRELYEQITLIWDAIHSNLMNHFSRYSERGEQLVHSTLSSYKLVRINRIIRSSSNSELKQQLDKAIQKAISRYNEDPENPALQSHVEKRNNLIEEQFDEVDRIEKTMAEKEKEASEFIRTSKRKLMAQQYEKDRKAREERERIEAEAKESEAQEEVEEMGEKSKGELTMMAEEAVQKRIQAEGKLTEKNTEKEEIEKELGLHQGELDAANNENEKATEELNSAIENNKEALSKRQSLGDEKRALEGEVLNRQRELEEARKNGDDAQVAELTTRIQELNDRKTSVDKAFDENEATIKQSEETINAAKQKQEITQKAVDEKQSQFNTTMEKQTKVDEEIRGLEKDVRLAKITEESAKQALKELRPDEEPMPDKRFMLTVRERDTAKERIPASIDFTMTGDLLKHKIGDIKSMLANKNSANEKDDEDTEDVVSSLKAAVDNYISKTKSMEKSKVEELNSKAGNILEKIKLSVDAK